MNRNKNSLAALAVTVGALFPTTSSAFDAICEAPELIAKDSAEVAWDVYDGELFSDVVFVDSADLDADGDLDLVLLGWFVPWDGDWSDEESGREGRILMNEGAMNFSVATGDVPFTIHPNEVLYEDFDGNGLTDIFVADQGYDDEPFPGWSNTLMLQFKEGWRNASARLPDDPNGFTHSATSADVDNDGDVDILVLNTQDDFKYLLLNDGDGYFEIDSDLMPESFPDDGSFVLRWHTYFVSFDDIDKDGFIDLFVGYHSDSNTGSFEENGEGSRIHWGGDDGFTDERVTLLGLNEVAQQLGTPELTIIRGEVFDFNGDGHLDLLLGGYDRTFSSRVTQLWMGAGHRQFINQTSSRLGSQANVWDLAWHQNFHLFDYNKDGYLDVVPEFNTVKYDAEVYAWLGDGQGFFSPLMGGDIEGDDEVLERLSRGYVYSDSELYATNFFPYEGRLRGSFGVPKRSSAVAVYPCPLSVLPPLKPIQKIGLEEELLP